MSTPGDVTVVANHQQVEAGPRPPHSGDWRQARVPAHARDYGAVAIARGTETHSGPLTAEHTALALKGDDMVTTSVHAIDGHYRVRCVNIGEHDAGVQTEDGLTGQTQLISGEEVAEVAPFKIAHVAFQPTTRTLE